MKSLMNKLLLLLPVLILLLFLLFPQPAMDGVRQGLLLWGGRILPALFPCLVCLNLLLKMGLMQSTSPIISLLRGAFSLTAGAPTGARLLKATYGDTPEALALCPALNALSPAFLLGVVALGQYGVKSCFYPLALGHYTAILVCLLLYGKPKPTVVPAPMPIKTPVFADAFSQSVFTAMESMLRIGGCVLLCSALASVLTAALSLGGLPKALLCGLLEVTGGCSALRDSGLSLRLQVSLCALFAGFGGLCIALQSLCFLPLKPGAYLLKKLGMGLISGTVCYLTFPLFVHDTLSAAFAPDAIVPIPQLTRRAAALGALGLSMGISLLFTLICTCIYKGGRTREGMQRKGI